MIRADLEKYIEDHTSDEDTLLYDLNRKTNLRTTLPRMISGKIQGKFLELISKIANPRVILEIGSFTGYSALCLVKGLVEGGILYTIESNVELEKIIQDHISKSENENKIKLIMGNALDVIPKIEETFDMVFIDANKAEYLRYYKLVLPKLSKGGLIIADNVLWSGKVTDQNPDADTKSLLEFNTYIKNDKSVEQVMLSIRDGLLVIRKL
ncbi:MAG: O-methyltransferase [Bacteroidales bacterium]|jgi:caffeoyl-CoA O-methyltransferase|nr:methyltransferase [Lentimicrobiaceae bacterium]MDG1136348.1 O-methyltransferase [Bacteroidales bacterium]MDG2081283.1 O-methyltransferase [Bacteroidales bacterium]|tara:strand:+ start:18799 stop:19428 length:630 start_codon:yes stop_codon:yes gene_type:complete